MIAWPLFLVLYLILAIAAASRLVGTLADRELGLNVQTPQYIIKGGAYPQAYGLAGGPCPCLEAKASSDWALFIKIEYSIRRELVPEARTLVFVRSVSED